MTHPRIWICLAFSPVTSVCVCLSEGACVRVRRFHIRNIMDMCLCVREYVCGQLCVCVRERKANDCVHVRVRVRVRVCMYVCVRVCVRVHVCTGYGRRFYNRDVAKPPWRGPELG